MMQPRTVQSTLAGALALALLATTGCSSGEVNSANIPMGMAVQPGPTPDFQAVVNTFVNGKFLTSPDYTQTSGFFGSKKDTGQNIVEWVTTSSAAEFLKIEPSDTNPDSGETPPNPPLVLPVGTTILRVVYLTPTNTDVTKYDAITYLTKGPPGYLPAFGDWAFGIVKPDGTPTLITEDNPGTLPGCHGGCHENDRGLANDYLFGTEKDALCTDVPKPVGCP